MKQHYTLQKHAYDTLTKLLESCTQTFSKNLVNVTEQEGQHAYQTLLLLARCIGMESNMKSSDKYTSCHVRPAEGVGSYEGEESVTVVIDSANKFDMVEDILAPTLLTLASKAERYDMLFTMKEEELKRLEEDAYADYAKQQEGREDNA